MKIELIQPFINAADAVLAQSLRCRTTVGSLTMAEIAYRRRGLAAQIQISGDIEGHIIFDLEPKTAICLVNLLAGGESDSEELAGEAVLELANQIIGNAVTTLNDQGFRFKVHPPVVHSSDVGLSGSQDTEALVLCFETSSGELYMNIAMRYKNHAQTAAAAS